MEPQYTQHLISQREGYFKHEQIDDEHISFAGADHRHTLDQPSTVDPRDLLLNIDHRSSIGARPNTESIDPSRIKHLGFVGSNCMLPFDQTLEGQKPWRPTESSSSNVAPGVLCPRHFASTPGVSGEVATTGSSPLPGGLAAPKSSQITLKTPTPTSSGELGKLSDSGPMFQQQDQHSKAPRSHTKPTPNSPNLSRKHHCSSLLMKDNEKDSMQPETRLSPHNSKSSTRSHHVRSDTCEAYPALKHPPVASEEQCYNGTPSSSRIQQSSTVKKSNTGLRSASSDSDYEQEQEAVDKTLGLGWKIRGEGDEWPAFGETREICAIFDQQGQAVHATVGAGFHFSRSLCAQVSNDGGELVHELQKRNVFHIKDMHYTLGVPDGIGSTDLAVKHDDTLRTINSMSIKLIGRAYDGELKRSHQTQLESRGPGRIFVSPQEFNENVTLRPRVTTGLFSRARFAEDWTYQSLPDSFTKTHLEFRRATPGNKTAGKWRIPSQGFYRLVLQLYAHLNGTENLVVVAESSTGLLLVRGRPPGGRGLGKLNKRAGKAKGKGAKPIPRKKQKREQRTAQEDGEGAWVRADHQREDFSTGSHLMQAQGGTAPDDAQLGVKRKSASKHYNTRNACKRTYKESDAEDGNEEDAEHEADDDDLPCYEWRPEEDSTHGVGRGHKEKIVDARRKGVAPERRQSLSHTSHGGHSDMVMGGPRELDQVIDSEFEHAMVGSADDFQLLFPDGLDTSELQNWSTPGMYTTQTPSGNTQQHLRSQIVGPDIPCGVVQISPSISNSESSHTTLSFSEDDQRHSSMNAKPFTGMSFSPDTVLYNDPQSSMDDFQHFLNMTGIYEH